jgi:hypothetical protein
MKPLKMLGLAALVASSLLTAGAGTAQATTFFTDSAKTIAYPSGTTMHWSQEQGQAWDTEVLASNGSTIATCAGSTTHGYTGAVTALSLPVSVGQYAWSECTQTIHTLSNGSLSFSYTSGSNATVTSSKSSWTVVFLGASCTYGTGEGAKLGTLTGGTAPVMTINATVNKSAGSFLCPSSVTWKAEEVLTAPHALYVGS